MEKPIVILFNGPPRSGKDTAGELLHALLRPYTVGHLEFKHYLRKMAIAFSELTEENVEYIETSGDKEARDHRIPECRSWRQWLIHISENVIKPMFGKDAFGHLMLSDVIKDYMDKDYLVITDCGFTEEVNVLKRADFKILVVRMHREGCTFQNDSREYIFLAECFSVDLYNDGSKQDLKDKIAEIHKLITTGAIHANTNILL